MTPAPIPRTLHELADLAEIRGTAQTAADLRRAASSIEAMSADDAERFEQRARRDRLADEHGISHTVHWQLRELVLGGTETTIRAAQTGVPLMIRRLRELRVVSSPEVLALVRQLGVLTHADLAAALDDGRVKAVLGVSLETRLRLASEALEVERRPITLGRALDLFDQILPAIGNAAPSVEALTPSGDVRRFEPLVFSIVLTGRAADPPAAIDAICGAAGIDDVVHRSGRRAILSVQQTEVDVRIAAPEEYGAVLFRTTGSRAHVAALARRRALPGFAAREEQIYAHVGLPYVPAELRQGDGELEAAAANRLPRLVAREHIRGDLHMHSTYSDGRDTVATMVAECCALGYEYIAITDHSESAAAMRTVTIEQLARQRDEIERLRERYPGIVIMHGIEADILPDGRLDFPDSVLERLDIVLASLHDPAGHDGAALTRRCIEAIRHPLVSIITHPANRLVGRRGGYDLDFAAIYEAAAETGTALEIDGAPSHLDLDGAHARQAVAAGVTVSIDSDCHRAVALDRQMQLGVGTARRGWVEPAHVLNARPIAGVRAFIAAKRARTR